MRVLGVVEKGGGHGEGQGRQGPLMVEPALRRAAALGAAAACAVSAASAPRAASCHPMRDDAQLSPVPGVSGCWRHAGERMGGAAGLPPRPLPAATSPVPCAPRPHGPPRCTSIQTPAQWHNHPSYDTRPGTVPTHVQQGESLFHGHLSEVYLLLGGASIAIGRHGSGCDPLPWMGRVLRALSLHRQAPAFVKRIKMNVMKAREITPLAQPWSPHSGALAYGRGIKEPL